MPFSVKASNGETTSRDCPDGTQSMLVGREVRLKLATFNVNSIRKRVHVVKRWLKHHAPDVLCLQETKVHDSEFPQKELASTGYHVTFCGPYRCTA